MEFNLVLFGSYETNEIKFLSEFFSFPVFVQHQMKYLFRNDVLLAQVNPTEDFQEDILGVVGNDGVGLAYDYAYNAMTASQRDVVRKMLVAATAGKKTCGVGKPGYSVTSNWTPFHLTLLTMSLAIEGEEG